MSPAGDREDRWANVARTAFLLNEQCTLQPDAPLEARLVHVRAAIHSLLEVFPTGVDPLDDFEGYAFRRWVVSLDRALQPEPAASR